MPTLSHASRRERQILEALFRLGKASAAQVREAIPDPPSNTAVRTMLRILESKGMVTHEEQAGRYFYGPAVSVKSARASAIRGLLDTFFEGSAAQAAVSLLGSSRRKLTREQLESLESIIGKAKKEAKND